MRAARVIAPVLVAPLLLTGCGAKDSTTTTPAGSNASASTSFSCPTDNTQTFPKVRFVTNVGLAAGAFRTWLWKPYQAGSFNQGADGRTAALVKGGLAAAFSAKQIHDAIDNVKADPTLCNAIGEPLSQLGSALDGLKDKVKNGDFTSLTSIEGLIGTVLSGSKKAGVEITEQQAPSL